MRRIEMLWRKKHSIASLDVKQLSNQRYSILKKHLLLDLELEELSQLDELNDTVREELDDVSDSPAETSNVLIDEPPLFVKKLPSNIQALWKMIMDYLPTEQSQRFFLSKPKYEITYEILAQTNSGNNTYSKYH